MTQFYDRRKFLIRAGSFALVGFAAASGLNVLSGCNSQEEAEKIGSQPHNAISAAQAVADPCNDLSGLSAGDLATRQTFKYEKRSTKPAQYCQACNFWQPDRQGGQCGTCTIVKGPIHPLGRCQSWTERTAG